MSNVKVKPCRVTLVELVDYLLGYLVGSYQQLEADADQLIESVGFPKQDFTNPRLSGDIQRMAKQSSTAQYIASCLSARYREFEPSILTEDTVRLAISSLKTVAAWKPAQEFFSSERISYDKRNLNQGLSIVGQVLWPGLD